MSVMPFAQEHGEEHLLCLGAERLRIAGGPWLYTGAVGGDEMADRVKRRYLAEGVDTRHLHGYRFVGTDGRRVILWSDLSQEAITLCGGRMPRY